MPIEDTINQGGVGSGVQPKDLPNPNLGGPTAAAQTEINSIPQGAPQTAPTQAQPAQKGLPLNVSVFGKGLASQNPSPSPDDQNASPGDVTTDEEKQAKAILDELDQKKPKTPEEDEREAKRLLDESDGKEIPIGGERLPEETSGQYMIRTLPTELKYVGAQMRAHLGDSPKDQKAAFQSMFNTTDKDGKVTENIKDAPGGGLLFRNSPDEKFRKVDQQLYGPLRDFFIFNALNAIPLAANAATQTAGNVASDGGLAITGMSGAAGGATEALTRQGMIAALNKVSAQPQTQTGDSALSDVAKTTAVNAIGAPLLSAGLGVAKSAVLNVGKALASTSMGNAFASSATEAAEWAAGKATTQLASIRNSFDQAIKIFHPNANTLDEPSVFAKGLQNIFGMAEKRLGGMVGAIKSEVISMAGDKKVPMDNSAKAMKDILSSYGYGAKDSFGDLTLLDHDKLNLAPKDVVTALSRMANHYNVLNQSKVQGGINPSQMFSNVEEIGALSKFEGPNNTGGQTAANLWQKVWGASADDRNQFVNQIYQPNGSMIPGINAKNWAGEFNKYSDQIGAVKHFSGLLQDSGSRENFLNAIMTGNKNQRANFLDAAKNILEPEIWDAMQGQMQNKMVGDFSPNGYVHGANLLKYMTSPANDGVVSRMFSSDQERNVFTKMVLTAGSAEKSGGLNEGQGQAITDGVKVILKHAGGAMQAVQNIFSAMGSNKVQLNYLMSQGFQDMIDKAEGPALRAQIFEARRITEIMTSKMKVAEVPTALANGTKKMVERYVPLPAALASRSIAGPTQTTSPGFGQAVSQSLDQSQAQ